METEEGKRGRVLHRLVNKMAVVIMLVGLASFGFAADGKAPVPERMDIIMVGDRVVDVAYNLGVLPVAMSVRGSFWPLADKLKVVSCMLGCPNCVTAKDKEAVPKAIEKYGAKRVILERSEPYCLYKKDVKPANVAPLLEGKNVQVDYVDFSRGVEDAVRQLGTLLDREKEAEALLEKRKKQLARMEKDTPESPLNLKVVVLNGVLQSATGKAFMRVETPGGYADKFMLEPLGCTNIGAGLIGEKKPSKGHVTIRSLAKLVEIKPDAVVITGDASPIQAAIHEAVENDPMIGEVPAFKNMAVYSLPGYFDSSVMEYPQIFSQWARALAGKG